MPEKALCAFLMENTSAEFPSHTVQGALACLRTPGSRRYLGKDTELTRFEVHSRHAKSVEDFAGVGVAYDADEERMVISVQRSPTQGR